MQYEDLYDYGICFKDALMGHLYTAQMKYWNKRLVALSLANVYEQSRDDLTGFVAVYFENKTWKLQEIEGETYATCVGTIPLTENPKLQKEMAAIALNMTELKIEEYEAERFLAGLVVFNPPPDKLCAILGDSLYRVCTTAFRQFWTNIDTMSWNTMEPESLETFLEEQHDIIISMQERVMMNLITV